MFVVIYTSHTHFSIFPHPPLKHAHVCRVLFSVKNSQAQLNAQDDDGWTPLHAAVYWGNMDAAEMLILHGADMDAVTKAVSVCACVCVFGDKRKQK